MTLPISLKEEILLYCKANGITNVDQFMVDMIKQGFNTEKYKVPSSTQTLLADKHARAEEFLENHPIPKDLYGED